MYLSNIPNSKLLAVLPSFNEGSNSNFGRGLRKSKADLESLRPPFNFCRAGGIINYHRSGLPWDETRQ